MKRVVGAVVAVMAVALVPACSEDADTSNSAVPASAVTSRPEPSSRPTLTAPNLQPPPQDGRWINEDRPDVVFDPCTWISDETIQEAGFDPASRERGQDSVAEWTFLVCSFESETIALSVLSGNVTLEEETEKNGSWQRPTTVNGRDATIGREPERRDSCTVNVGTETGVVFVDQLLTLQGRTQRTDPCVDIEKTAALIEQEIGEGN